MRSKDKDFNDSETSDTVLNGLGLAVADTGGFQMVQLVAAGFILGAAVGAAPLAAPLAVGYEACKILGVGYEVCKFASPAILGKIAYLNINRAC